MKKKKLSREKIKIISDGPILHGSISTAKSTCGKPNCRCKKDPPQLHGTYYRWTGVINGKRTTKTISKEVALECIRRIKNYKKLKKKLDVLIKKGVDIAPWNDKMK